METYLKASQLANNQIVIRDFEHNKDFFQSYKTLIACVDRDKHQLILGWKWDYSHTTMKWLYQFLYIYASGLEGLEDLENKPNKRAYIQSLIDNGSIKYDYNMQ